MEGGVTFENLKGGAIYKSKIISGIVARLQITGYCVSLLFSSAMKHTEPENTHTYREWAVS
jgi:hypothetical protein